MEKQIKLKNAAEALALFGPRDEELPILEKDLGVKIVLRLDTLRISGSNKNLKNAITIIERILNQSRLPSETHRPKQSFNPSQSSPGFNPGSFTAEKVDIGFSFKGRTISPRSAAQCEYVQAIKDYDIVFGVGPAGTGKTYLAMAMAVEALRKGYARRIILTRPALEAGESLGYLPGTLYEKILPYLRPLYDALYDMMEADRIEKYIEIGTIEVAPLAFMRGRTLNDAFVILDEAQNCTVEQLKMFLTRLGFDSKTVITGDTTQSDLPRGRPVGLVLAIDILKPIQGIKFVHFTGKDVVRHELVQKIIAAYEKLSTAR